MYIICPPLAMSFFNLYSAFVSLSHSSIKLCVNMKIDMMLTQWINWLKRSGYLETNVEIS